MFVPVMSFFPQALGTELIEYRQHPECLAVAGAIWIDQHLR